jgi:PTS system nitrogen regulatory IIA component
MVNDNRLPYVIKIGGQWRFNREKVEKWLQSGKKNTRNKPLSDKGITLLNTLKAENILYKINGTNRDEILEQILSVYNNFQDADNKNIKKALLYKESIISSSINGISVMIMDYDTHIHIENSLFLIAYLDKPADFKAIDSIETNIVIMIIPANKTEQLILSTRLRGLLMQPEFVSSLRKEPNRTELIETINRFEKDIYTSR